jgi:hypothetical protein
VYQNTPSTIPPAVAPEVDLVFWEKAESPLTLFRKNYICTTDWGIRYVQKELEILSMGRNDVALGCSKCW